VEDRPVTAGPSFHVGDKNISRQYHYRGGVKMIRCPACGSMNMDGSALCKKCRQQLPNVGISVRPSVVGETQDARTLLEELKKLEPVGPDQEVVTRELVRILTQGGIPPMIDRFPGEIVDDSQKMLAEMADEKLDEMEKHLQAPSKDAGLMILLGSAAFILKEYEKALDRFNAAVQLDGNSSLAEYNRGMALQSLGKFEDAVLSFTRVITLKPDFEQAWANKGRTLYAMGRGKEALEYFERALCLDRNDFDAWFSKGISEEEMGQFQEAIKCLDIALKLRPDFVQAWNFKGDALFNMGMPEEALAAYEQALTIRPHDFEAWNNKGIVLFTRKDVKGALEAFEKALMACAESADAWFNKGTALEVSGMLDEALACYDRALRLDSEHDGARKSREKLYALGMTSGEKNPM
jgi:tetratricopeptide (TPR) repeat protein